MLLLNTGAGPHRPLIPDPDPNAGTETARAVWIDLVSPTEAERAAAERATGLRVPSQAELAEVEASSRLSTEGQAVYLSTPMSYPGTDDVPTVAPLGFVLSPDHLLTVRSVELPVFDLFAQRFAQAAEGAPSGSAGAFVGLLPMRRLAFVVLLWAGGAAAQGGTDPAPPSAVPVAPLPAPVAPTASGQPIAVDRQVNHPNGTTLVVNSISARRTSTVLDVTITTGPEGSRLNDFGMALVDDQGGRYPVVPPPGNPDLAIPTNSAMEGELVFAGRLNPAARRVSLVVNERAGSPDSRVSNTPQMRLEIPLPQRGGRVEPPGGPADGPEVSRRAAGLPPGIDRPAHPDDPAGSRFAADGGIDASRFSLDPPAGFDGGPALPDGPEASRLAVAHLPAADAPARIAALVPSRLVAAEPASGAGASGTARGGPGNDVAASRPSVEQLRRDLGVRQTERGELVSLPGDALFDFDRADIRHDAEPTLRKLADLIAQTRPGRVLVEGHTDSRGADARNRRLSERRAEAVARWLAANGVDPGLTQSRGLGETRPVVPNQRPNGADDPDGRRRNRRVEVVLRRA